MTFSVFAMGFCAGVGFCSLVERRIPSALLCFGLAALNGLSVFGVL